MFNAPRFIGSAAIAVVLATFAVLSPLPLKQATAGLIIIPAPPSVLLGAIQDQDDAYAFFESTTTLAAPLAVDISMPGLYNLGNPDDPGVIPKGTPVNSYFLHHESVSQQLSPLIVAGSFPNKILGIIIGDTNLDVSDPILGNPGTLYPTGLDFRGLEVPFFALADVVFWSGNQVSFSIKSTTALVLDQVRIITAVPEPSTFALAASALPMAWWYRKRLRKRSRRS